MPPTNPTRSEGGLWWKNKTNQIKSSVRFNLKAENNIRDKIYLIYFKMSVW